MPRFVKIIVVLIAVALLGTYIRPGYFLVKPGSTEGLGRLIELEGEPRQEEGEFLMVTVTQQQGNLWGMFYGVFHPFIDVRPISGSIPPGMDREEYNELMRSWMQDSQNLARVIALRKAGYEVPIASDGVEVVELIPDSPAQDILFPGDIIKGLDGEEVHLAEEVVRHIQNKRVGEPVTLSIIREGEEVEAEVITATNPEQPDLAALRVYVKTLNWRPLLPLSISIETGPVVGPSAGVMFVLEILDRLVPENLTGGYLIAGTGMITLNGEIGSIGGVKQKVLAAEQAGADYFLVPRENYREALQAARSMEIIEVESLDEVLVFLKTLSGQVRAQNITLGLYPGLRFIPIY